MVHQLLDGPFSESLIKEGCLRDFITYVVEEPHSLFKEKMLLRGRVKFYFEGQLHI